MPRELCDFARAAFSVLPWVYPSMKNALQGKFCHTIDLQLTGPEWVPKRWEGKWGPQGNEFYDFKLKFIYEAAPLYSLSLFLKRNQADICLTGWHALRFPDKSHFGPTIEELLTLSAQWRGSPRVLNLNPEL